jgi:hypothetical protein
MDQHLWGKLGPAGRVQMAAIRSCSGGVGFDPRWTKPPTTFFETAHNGFRDRPAARESPQTGGLRRPVATAMATRTLPAVRVLPCRAPLATMARL